MHFVVFTISVFCETSTEKSSHRRQRRRRTRSRTVLRNCLTGQVEYDDSALEEAAACLENHHSRSVLVTKYRMANWGHNGHLLQAVCQSDVAALPKLRTSVDGCDGSGLVARVGWTFYQAGVSTQAFSKTSAGWGRWSTSLDKHCRPSGAVGILVNRKGQRKRTKPCQGQGQRDLSGAHMEQPGYTLGCCSRLAEELTHRSRGQCDGRQRSSARARGGHQIGIQRSLPDGTGFSRSLGEGGRHQLKAADKRPACIHIATWVGKEAIALHSCSTASSGISLGSLRAADGGGNRERQRRSPGKDGRVPEKGGRGIRKDCHAKESIYVPWLRMQTRSRTWIPRWS